MFQLVEDKIVRWLGGEERFNSHSFWKLRGEAQNCFILIQIKKSIIL